MVVPSLADMSAASMEQDTQDTAVDSGEQAAADNELRERLRGMLADGLETEVEPRAYDHDEVQKVVGSLQTLSSGDYENKLRIAGFTLTPWHGANEIEQACETCMYYVVHRRFCELPELMLPVEPEWSCRLWRI